MDLKQRIVRKTANRIRQMRTDFCYDRCKRNNWLCPCHDARKEYAHEGDFREQA